MQDVLVSHRGANQGDAFPDQGLFQGQVGHDGSDHLPAGQCLHWLSSAWKGRRGHVVAVETLSASGDKESPVRVPVEGHPQIQRVGLSRPGSEPSRCRDPQSRLMFRPSGRSLMTVTSAPNWRKSRGARRQAAPLQTSRPTRSVSSRASRLSAQEVEVVRRQGIPLVGFRSSRGRPTPPGHVLQDSMLRSISRLPVIGNLETLS